MPSSRFDFSKVSDLNLTFNDISSIFCYFSSLKKQGGLALRPLSFRVILKMSQNVSIKRKSKITRNWLVYLKFLRRILRKLKNLNVDWQMCHLVFLPTNAFDLDPFKLFLDRGFGNNWHRLSSTRYIQIKKWKLPIFRKYFYLLL